METILGYIYEDGLGATPAKQDVIPVSQTDQSIIIMMRVLQANGFPNKIIPYCLAQFMHETKNLTSRLTQWWNYAGIKLTKWAKENVDAFDAGNGYAGYRTLDGFARDYKRILQLQPGDPFQAQTAQQFLDGLYKNRYFTDNYANYSSGLNRGLKIVNDVLTRAGTTGSDLAQRIKAGDEYKATWDNRKGITDIPGMFADLKEWEKVGIGAGLLLLAIVAVKS